MKSYHHSAFAIHRSNHLFSNVVLFFLLIINCFVDHVLHSFIVFLAVCVFLVINDFAVKKKLFYLLLPFLLILLIGSHGIINSPLNLFFKDAWYVLKIVFSLTAGYLISQHIKHIYNLLRLIVFSGFIAAIVHLFQLFLFWQDGLSLIYLRQQFGIGGFFITVLACSILLTYSNKKLNIFKPAYPIITLLCLSSLFLAYSRTYFLVLFIVVSVLRGWNVCNTKNFIFLGLNIIVLVIIFYLFINLSNLSNIEIINKMLNSFDEISVKNYNSAQDINEHWRGFESFKAITQYFNNNFFYQLFGEGLGSTVDLGFYMQLGGEQLRYISLLHNGYLYVTLKYGVFGLVLYLFFNIQMITKISYIGISKDKSVDHLVIARMLSSLGWLLLFTMFVITGPFNKIELSSIVVLVGVFYGLHDSNKARNNSVNYIGKVGPLEQSSQSHHVSLSVSSNRY